MKHPKLFSIGKWIGKKFGGLNATIINDIRTGAYPNIHPIWYNFKYAETIMVYNGCLLLITILAFLFFYSLQFGPFSSIINSHFSLIIPTKLINFIYENICLWSVPFLFLMTWLLFFIFTYIVCLRRLVIFQTKRNTTVRDSNSIISLLFGHVLIIQIPLIIFLFIILLLHERNSCMNYIIQAQVIHLFNDNFSSLFTYFTASSPVLIVLLILLLLSYLVQVNILFVHKSVLDLFNVGITYLFWLFITLLIFYCNNFLLLIFLLDFCLLLLLNLIRLQKYQFSFVNFFKSIFVFICVQSIGTLIYAYGLSIMYLQNQSLSFNIINDINIYFGPFYFEMSPFIIKGSIFIIIALFLKIGLGPFGLWLLNTIKIFNYPTLIFYFSFLKPLYFIIITKIIALIFSDYYNQKKLSEVFSILHNDQIKLDYLKFILEKKLNFSEKFTDDSISLIITQAQYLQQDIIMYTLIFSLFSIIVGVFGLIYTNNFKKFIVYSSMLNYSLIFLLIFYGTMSSIHYSVIFIFIYSITNIFFISFYSYLTNFKELNLSSIVYYFNNNFLMIVFVLCVLSLAGFPPMIGFFIKINILLELTKFLGVPLSLIFIFFTFLGNLGYIRFLKNIFYFNKKYILIFYSRYILNYFMLPIMYRSCLFIFFLLICFFIFSWVDLFFFNFSIKISNFNAFVYYNNSIFYGSLIEYNLFKSDIHILINSDILINNYDEYIQHFVNSQIDQYSQVHYILTGKLPTQEQLTFYKTGLVELAQKKLQFFTLGDGLEYSKKHELCLSSVHKYK